ncbi:MAG: hypothetical protein EXS63_01435 [Candidatus Omnitrophica bacterium]|nr:hypothetical protein [Candidatus Omnitrophota bacterium]
MPRLLSAKVAAFLIFLLVLDLSIFPSLLGTVRPVALYLFVVYVAFEWHWSKTLLAAVMVGLLRDAMTLQPFGVETAALFLTTLGLNVYVQKISSNSWMGKWIGTFIFVQSVFLLVGILTHIANQTVVFSWVQMRMALWISFWTAGFMPVFFFLANRWFKKDFYISRYPYA